MGFHGYPRAWLIKIKVLVEVTVVCRKGMESLVCGMYNQENYGSWQYVRLK